MQFLQSNQFIWDDSSQEYLFGDGVQLLMQNSDLLRKIIEDKLDNCVWFDSRAVFVESENDWISLAKVQGTDIIEIKDASFYQKDESQFDLVQGVLKVDWMFIGESGKMACSFSKVTNHPLIQLSEALKRLVKQGLDRDKFEIIYVPRCRY
ncbi:MAG: hypothetical protein RI989_1322 [Bacteroidota bacterium]